MELEFHSRNSSSTLKLDFDKIEFNTKTWSILLELSAKKGILPFWSYFGTLFNICNSKFHIICHQMSLVLLCLSFFFFLFFLVNKETLFYKKLICHFFFNWVLFFNIYSNLFFLSFYFFIFKQTKIKKNKIFSTFHFFIFSLFSIFPLFHPPIKSICYDIHVSRNW